LINYNVEDEGVGSKEGKNEWWLGEWLLPGLGLVAGDRIIY